MLGNIGETFELLFDKNNNVAYKALLLFGKLNDAFSVTLNVAILC